MVARNPAPFLHLCPQRRDAVDVRQLDLGRQEAFVWSHIDGQTTLQQLADLTAVSPTQVLAMLERMEADKAIVWPDDAPLRPIEQVPQVPAASDATDLSTHPALLEPGELDRSERLRILTMEQRLGQMTPWEVLGVRPDTPPQGLKKAYFEASKSFHPDRFFGKKLGSFAVRLQRIFEHIKQAHDTLLDETFRQTYMAAHPPPAAVPASTPDSLAEHRRAITEQRQRSSQVDQAERAAQRAAKSGDWTQARIWVERAVQLAPQRVALRLTAAHVCEAAGDVAAARRHLQLAASLDKTNNDVKNFLARLSYGESNRH